MQPFYAIHKPVTLGLLHRVRKQEPQKFKNCQKKDTFLVTPLWKCYKLQPVREEGVPRVFRSASQSIVTMKKTIITLLALLAASTANAASYTSNHGAITAVGEGFDPVQIDLFTALAGNSKSDAIAAAGTYSNQGPSANLSGNYLNDAGNSGFAGLTQTVVLNNLINSFTLDSKVVLDSFSFISRLDAHTTGSSTVSNVYLQVSDASGVLGTSLAISYDADATTANTFGVSSFSFAGCGANGADIVLDSSASYTFTLVTKNEDSSYSATTTYLGMAAVKGPLYTIEGVQHGYSANGANPGVWSADVPIYSIATHTAPAVPEPATATLSLLALAGLAARRRRK